MSWIKTKKKRTHYIQEEALGGPGQSVIFCGQFNTCPSVPLPTPAFALV